MQEEEAPKGCTKNEVVHARLSQGLKQSLDLYAEAHGLTLSSAVATLLEHALEDGSEMDDIKATVSEISKRLDLLKKDCALASKRAGKASQASLGTLALIAWLAPDAMRFLANEALLRGQVLAKLLDNDAAAANVKVPSSLGRLANRLSSSDLFRMAYSEIGGKLSRDPKTMFMPALASAVRMFDLDAIGILDMDPAEWQRIGSGDAAAIESLAAREAKKARHG